MAVECTKLNHEPFDGVSVLLAEAEVFIKLPVIWCGSLLVRWHEVTKHLLSLQHGVEIVRDGEDCSTFSKGDEVDAVILARSETGSCQDNELGKVHPLQFLKNQVGIRLIDLVRLFLIDHRHFFKVSWILVIKILVNAVKVTSIIDDPILNYIGKGQVKNEVTLRSQKTG